MNEKMKLLMKYIIATKKEGGSDQLAVELAAMEEEFLNKFGVDIKNEKCVLPMGQHMGESMKEVPVDYLEWLLDNWK